MIKYVAHDLKKDETKSIVVGDENHRLINIIMSLYSVAKFINSVSNCLNSISTETHWSSVSKKF